MSIHDIISDINKANIRSSAADIRAGETVRVHYKIKEGNKERIQIFEGLVIGCSKGKSLQGSFTVRKVVAGVGVERTFPLHSPWIVKIERVRSGKVRRAKLNYVRRFALSSKFRLKDKKVAGTVWEDVVPTETPAEDQIAQDEAAVEADDAEEKVASAVEESTASKNDEPQA